MDRRSDLENIALRDLAHSLQTRCAILGESLRRFTRGRTGSLTGVRLTGALVRIHSQASALLGEQSAKRRADSRSTRWNSY